MVLSPVFVPGGSSFRGIHVFQLKLYFLTSRQVYQRMSSILCKKYVIHIVQEKYLKNVLVRVVQFFLIDLILNGC